MVASVTLVKGNIGCSCDASVTLCVTTDVMPMTLIFYLCVATCDTMVEEAKCDALCDPFKCDAGKV